MKNVIYLLVAVFLVACGGSNTNNVYEKTISGYVLKDNPNSAWNLNFKVVELAEQGNITVADSIAYLTDEFRKDKQLIVSRIELARKMSEDLQSKTKMKNEFDKYGDDIARMNNNIDSLKNLVPDNLQGYDSRNANDVLIKIARKRLNGQKEWYF
jgi:hypothetical protein